jgi:hypothetical protein
MTTRGHEHSHRNISVFELTAKAQEELPFNLDNLCNFQYSFDVLKKAIEYLSKQQRDQAFLIVDLIESMKEKDGRPV